MQERKIVVIGGVAGGASAAAKARRTDEHAKITIFEKGPYISFANCGLPYYVSCEIKNRRLLLLQSPEGFKKRFNIDVQVNREVLKIKRSKKVVIVEDKTTGDTFEEEYDKIILSPGATTFIPPIPGIDASNVFTLRTVPDAEKVLHYIATEEPKTAVVLGGGYIGLEAAESLCNRKIKVTIVEALPQILTLLDPDMALYIQKHIKDSNIDIILGDGVAEIIKKNDGTVDKLILKSGKIIETDLVIAAMGVRPNIKLAVDAGLEIGKTGAIKVNEKMQTSDPDIYSAGDAIESYNLITREWGWTPLAGPANKQGRIAGANAAGADYTFPGILGTSIVRFNKYIAAKTGLSEREARAAGIDYFVTTTHSKAHAGYYPGAEMVHIKILVEKATGRIIGGQVVGEESVDKQIDIIATAMFFKATANDLANLDLAYAPPFGSAKDPVNIAGMTAQNRLKGEERAITFDEYLKEKDKYNLLDVRTAEENRAGKIEGSILIPVDELRNRLDEIPKDKPVAVYCRAGYRGYIAQKILIMNGFDAYNIDSGYYNPENLEAEEQLIKS